MTAGSSDSHRLGLLTSHLASYKLCDLGQMTYLLETFISPFVEWKQNGFDLRSLVGGRKVVVHMKGHLHSQVSERSVLLTGISTFRTALPPLPHTHTLDNKKEIS